MFVKKTGAEAKNGFYSQAFYHDGFGRAPRGAEGPGEPAVSDRPPPSFFLEISVKGFGDDFSSSLRASLRNPSSFFLNFGTCVGRRGGRELVHGGDAAVLVVRVVAVRAGADAPRSSPAATVASRRLD